MSTKSPLPRHPLDPLSGEEMSRAVAILRESGHLIVRVGFGLQEPAEEFGRCSRNFRSEAREKRGVGDSHGLPLVALAVDSQNDSAVS